MSTIKYISIHTSFPALPKFLPLNPLQQRQNYKISLSGGLGLAQLVEQRTLSIVIFN